MTVSRIRWQCVRYIMRNVDTCRDDCFIHQSHNREEVVLRISISSYVIIVGRQTVNKDCIEVFSRSEIFSGTPNIIIHGHHKNKTKRNETKRNETKRNETKRNETKRNETKRNETKRNETKRNENETKRRKKTHIIFDGSGSTF